MFEYTATVVNIVDGDTAYFEIDLGFRINFEIDCRFYGINAPELHGTTKDAGLASKNYVVAAIPVGSTVKLQTYKADKYGRWLADIFYGPNFANHLNQEMVDKGLAVPYMVNQ